MNNLVGMKFGKLTVVKREGSSKDHHALWLCECECGNKKLFQSNSLKTGSVKSCGCNQHSRKYRKADKKLLTTWNHIKERCSNKHCESYKYYGGRGITVCDEWKNDFQAFYNYVSQLPHYGEEGRSIDRINVDGNYEPGNIRWATMIEQANNKRNNVLIELNGEIHTATEWANILNLKQQTVFSRIKAGKTSEEVLK